MTGSREPEALVRALSEERVPPEEPAICAERRERLVPDIARAIRHASGQRERRIRLHRIVAGVLVASTAAASVLVGVSRRTTQPAQSSSVNAATRAAEPAPVAMIRSIAGTVVLTHADRGRVLVSSDLPPLQSGDRLETAADGGAFVQTERSAIHVQHATQISVLPPSVLEERIRVASGRVDLKVSKQPRSPRSVVVETPNAEVVVRGTQFSVSVGSEQDAPVTRVHVTEGAVWVLHDGERDLVSVGEEWSSSPQPKPAAQALQVTGKRTVSAVARGHGHASAHEPSSSPEKSSPEKKSALAEENRMYTAALEARNRGEDRRALELFGALLSRFPEGQLSELAQVERMRAFKRLGDASAAKAEARRYLAEHPGGGAVRDEARGIALGER